MIEEVFKKLYEAPAEYRWVLANCGIGKLIGGNLADGVSFGRQGRIVRRLMASACLLRCARLLVAVVALAEMICLMKRAGRVTPCVLPHDCRLFIGFGAGPEEEMWHEFQHETGGEAIRLDETCVETFLAYHRPSMRALAKQVWRESGAVVPFVLRSDIEPLRSYRKDTLTYVALRMARYIFFRTWWAGLKSHRIAKVAFLAADTPAYGCVDAGVAPVEYRQHGLLRKSILMPTFHRLKMLTQAEASWYQRYFSELEIEVLPPQKVVTQHQPRILVASCYEVATFLKATDLARVQSLIRWAKDNQMEVVVRKHPRETDDFWEAHFPELEVDTTRDRFEDALIRIKPMFVASWLSTSLVDALLANVIPVSVMDFGDQHLQDMVFEIPQHCLLWPQHQMVMDTLLSGEVAVESVVLELLSNKAVHFSTTYNS
jgi:hypothetical protein